MNTHSNLHAANATSIVGNAIPIPSRNTSTSTGSSTSSTNPSASAAAVSAAAANNAAVVTGLQNAAAAAAAQMSLNQMRAAFKPVAPSGSVLAPPAIAMATTTTTNPSNLVMKMNPPPIVPNTAGAGALNLSGRWYLDRHDSDSMNDYLEAMGLPLIARQAADKLDLMVVIHQTPGEFSITRRTRIFMETKVLKFGQEVNIKGNIIKLIGDATTIKTWTQLSLAGLRGLLTDIRTIDEKERMCVELTLQLPDRTPVCTRRYFTKTSESTTLEDLPPFDMSLETAGDVKRKR